jgi:hypothetical protein
MTTLRAALATAAAALACAAPASAGLETGESPTANHDCDMEVKRTYQARDVLKKGVPVIVTCDGPATIVIALDFEGRRVGDWITERFGHGGDPGAEAHTGRPLTVREGATPMVLRMRFTRWALPMVHRFPRIPMHIGLGHRLTEHRFPVRREDRAISYLVRRGGRARAPGAGRSGALGFGLEWRELGAGGQSVAR